MKILFYVQTESDYGPDTIYDGLCRVIGSENVLEYPHKPNYHSEKVGRYLHYPCLFDYPIHMTDAEKKEMLKNNEFDCIIIACRVEPNPDHWDIRYQGEFYELLKEKSKNIPTFLLDQGDLMGKKDRVAEELNCVAYFKRECTSSDGVVPLSLAYSDKYIENNPDPERTNPLFWAGTFNSYRKNLLYACGDLINRNRYSQEEYRQELLRAKIGLCVRGFGFDTVRYYEVPAHRALLFAQRLPIIIDNNFIDGESAIFFETPEELKEKLNFLLNHDDLVEKIRHKGYDHYKQFHTSTARAGKILETIKQLTK